MDKSGCCKKVPSMPEYRVNALLFLEYPIHPVRDQAIICYCQFGKAIIIIQRRSEIASEKQVDLESNAVSRILNMEFRAQLPANTSDALLWKIIEQAKKL